MKDLPYFELRAAIYTGEQDIQTTVKLKDLEGIWFCSAKNAKRKLKQYEMQGRLTYQPGKGRGNASVLVFAKPFQQEIEETVTTLANNDQLEEIIQLLQLPIPKSWIANVSADVQKLFGLNSPTESKDVLRTVIKRKLTTLEPMHSSITLESHLIRQLGDTLVTYNQENDRIQPHLAHHFKHDAEFTTWTFYLRKGILFHDGETMTSEDVKYTIERAKKHASPNDWLVAGITRIDCLTPYCIQFQLSESNPFFLRYLSALNLAILPRHTAFNEFKWIGTGPFRLAERSDTKLVLEAFDSYFLERPFLDRVEFWHVPVDAFQEVTFELSEQELTNDPLQLESIETGFRFLAFNFNRKERGLIHNKFFREAIYHLLDPNLMWLDLNRGELVEASSFFPWNSIPQKRDESRIHVLLNNADYRGESLKLYSLNYPKAIEEATWLKQKGEQYGIHFQVMTFDLEELYSPLLDEQADLVFLGEVASLDAHLSFLGAFYNKALLFRRFLTPGHLSHIDTLLEELKRKPTAPKRDRVVSEVEHFLRQEYLILFQHHPVKSITFHPMIRDMKPDAFNSFNFSRVWIE